MNLRGLCDELKNFLSIGDVMLYYGVEFASMSGKSWKAKCWRHSDSTPSVSVSIDKGLFHCFSTGCDVSGDIVSFYQQYFNVEAPEAAKRLAEEFGVDASPFIALDQSGQTRERHFRIIGAITDACHSQLRAVAGAKALAYVKKRGVDNATIDTFKLGFSQSPEFITKIAVANGATQGDCKALGLSLKYSYGNTILFPIYSGGRPAFFYSKSLSGVNGEGPKYVGPGASHPLRGQGQMFGLQIARAHVREAKNLTLVEGFFDALVLHSKGFKNTVCMLGSSPRPDQMKIFNDIHVPQVTVLFDPDKAGTAGVMSAIKARQGTLKLKVGFIPEGDPDEYVIAHGKDALQSILDQSISAVDFILGAEIDNITAGDLGDRAGTIGTLVDLSKHLPKNEASLFFAEINKLTGVPVEDLMDSITVSEQPKGAESEAIVLAACLKDEMSMLQAENKFKGRNVWSVNRNFYIWNALTKLKKQKVIEYTPELVRQTVTEVKLNGELDSLFTRDFSNFEYHANLVFDGYIRRTVRKSADKLLRGATDQSRDASDVISDHLSTLAKDVAGDGSKEFTSQQQVETAMDYIHSRMESDDEVPGIQLGADWRQLTQLTLGWQPSRMYLISALPKVGKTSLALNWTAEAAIKQRIPWVYFNLEMSERDLSLRILSILSGISNTRLAMGAIGDPEIVKLDEAAELYHQAPLYVVNAAGMMLPEIVNLMRKYVYSHGVRGVTMDYIQLIRHNNTKLQYWERHQDISTELKSAITELGIPLIGVSQLSKAATQGGGAANMGGAFKYLQDCDMAMELVKRDKDDPSASGNLLLNIEYNRHGSGESSIDLMFDPESLRVREVD